MKSTQIFLFGLVGILLLGAVLAVRSFLGYAGAVGESPARSNSTSSW